MELRGATTCVTGASGGIGGALVAGLVDRGAARVLAGVRDPGRLGAAGERVEPVRMDLSSREAIDACCDALGDRLGRVDVLVNNAGRFEGGLLERQDVADVYALFQVNLVAVAHLTARVLPHMLGRGRGLIVNNASISGYAFFPGATTYAASKAGVVAFSEALRRELHGTGVGVVHLVTPGVRTRMLAETRDAYAGLIDTSSWDQMEPDEWAAKVLDAIEAGAHVVSPGGKTGAARLAARGPAKLLDLASARMFSRSPR